MKKSTSCSVGFIFLCAMLLSEVSVALDAVSVFEMNRRAVGAVATQNAIGSGVVIAPQTVLTNCHVIAGQREIVFRQNNVTHAAKLVAGSVVFDLCKLSVPTLNAKPVVTRSAGALKVGERVYAIGNPRGLELSLSEGLISGLRDIENDVQIQTTAPISPGSSGGGLFDNSGRLIGIVTWYLANGQNLNFAMPIALVSQLSPMAFVDAYPESQILRPDKLDTLIATFERGDVSSMRAESARWLKHDSGSAFALSLAAMTFAELDQRELTEQALMQALLIQPNYTVALAELGNISAWRGDSTKSDNYFRACADVKTVSKSFTGAYRALCKARFGDKSSASDMDGYIESNPSRSWLHLVAAQVFFYLKDYDRAKAAALRSLEINPQSAMARAVLSIAFAVSRQPLEALSHAESAVAIAPNSPSILSIAVLAALVARQNDAVKRYFTRLSDVAPARARTLRNKFPSGNLPPID